MVRLNNNGRVENYDKKINNLKRDMINDHEVSLKIKEKAEELRQAGPDSEMLILSEYIQVRDGFITDEEEKQKINQRFEDLTNYKIKVLEEYKKNKIKK